MDKSAENKKIGRALVLDELFDLILYKSLQKITSGDLLKILDELIPVETRHYAFWQQFYEIKIDRLDAVRRLKLGIILLICRIFGEPAMYLALESIEVYGIRKYLTLWRLYRNTPLGAAVRATLEDEFGHEDRIVSGLEQKKINPERIRIIFLGFNDGLVEFLGAVGGFFAAFQDMKTVLIASATGAAAGALSMAVGVFASSSSEKDMHQTAFEKEQFLLGAAPSAITTVNPLSSAVIVGIFYIFGAMIPILPIFLGAKSVWVSLICGGMASILLTIVLSFISGMQMRKRVLTNLAMIMIAVVGAYVVGIFVKNIF